MGQFKFIHAADIHLDSPLRGLEGYDGAPVDAIRQASRQALINLVDLAIDQDVRFVLIAGDLYDGDWRNFNTGLFFVAQMTRLREARVPVVLIAGNHDAANKMTKDLPLPENVKRLSTKSCDTLRIEDCGVSIHGQGFASAAVLSDLSAAYCAADPGNFNIGLLHTCADGAEGHERYAPCTRDGLRSKGYDYWALGHVHKRQDLHRPGEPPIVFPGNIQGRHIREAGPKGCAVVTVGDDHRPEADFQALDVFRWECCEVDATALETTYDVLDRFAEELRSLLQNRDGRPLAVRVEITGACPAHEKLAAEPDRWKNEIRSLAVESSGGDVWVEKVNLRSRSPDRADEMAVQDGPVGELVQYINSLSTDGDRLTQLSDELAELRRKLPIELREGPNALRIDDPVWLGEVLSQSRYMLIERLMSKQTVHRA